MAHIKLCLALVTGLFLQRAAAHFILDYPVSAGFDDDGESSYPCGGFNVTFGANNTDYHVGGEAIALTTFHPQANWLYRATLDQSASGNWTNLLPVISQTALNGFCEPSVAVPASWAGKRGVIQVVGNAVDGLLYQCAGVNFVAGTASATPSTCKNATALTATFGSDPTLASLPGGATTSNSTNSTSTATTGASTPTASKPSAASTSRLEVATLLGGTLAAGLIVLLSSL